MSAPAVNDDVHGAVVHDCRVDAPTADWPPLQLLVLYPPRQPGAAPAQEREVARRLAREVVAQRVGAAAASGLEWPRAARGAQRLSFSYEASASLLAWCPNGAIGVDLVDLYSLALTSQQDLVATAALYLGPEDADEVAAPGLASEARIRFAMGWASLEARLKCLGRELDEWQPALKGLLGSTGVAPVRVMGRDGRPSARWIGSVAWRAGTPTRGGG